VSRFPPATRFFTRRPDSVFAAGQPAVVDARLTDNSQDKLVESFKALTVRGNDLPLRPDFGKIGTPIKLRANFFPFKDLPKGPLYEYDVAISPAAGTAARRVKRRIFKLAEQTTDWANAGLRGVVAHDHAAKVISAKKLTMPITITVPFYEEDQTGPTADGKEYTLTFQFVQELDTQRLLGCVLSDITT
jgi:eukaryotic translation initiation factor 2C